MTIPTPEDPTIALTAILDELTEQTATLHAIRDLLPEQAPQHHTTDPRDLLDTLRRVIDEHKNCTFGACACGAIVSDTPGQYQRAWRRHLAAVLHDELTTP